MNGASQAIRFVDTSARAALSAALSVHSRANVGGLPVQILFFREVTSTMDASRSFEPIAREYPHELITASLPLTTPPIPSLAKQHCVLSLSQTQGRGRNRREWKSQEGSGIFATFHFTIHGSASELLGYPLAVAVGVAETARRFGAPVGLKWPNDIWSIGSAQQPIGKLSGILIESSSDTEHENILHVSVGVGLNLESVDVELPYPRSALREVTSQEFDYYTVFVELLCQLADITNRFFCGEKPAIFHRWKELCFLWGRSVDVITSSATIRVKCVDLDANGGLIVEDEKTKIRQTLFSHEVSIRMDAFAV